MPNRATMLALAALYDVAKASGDIVIPRSLQLRALLTLLWRQSDGDRRPYKGFWDAVTEITAQPHDRDGQARAMYAQTYWLAIARSLGISPERTGAWNWMNEIVAEHHRLHPADRATRDALAIAVQEAALTREIIATKGHPHSDDARALIEQRRAARLSPEGRKP